jgi:putative acetyltransferase
MIQFRKASPGDRQEIFELYMDEKANPYLTYDPMPTAVFTALYDELLTTQTLYVGCEEDRLVATFRLIPKSHRQSHVLYLGSFVIINQLQGKGIGTLALRFIMQYALSKRFKRIELTVDLHNDAAIHLYKKAGFETEGIVRKSYKLQSTGLYYDEYLMGLLLP